MIRPFTLITMLLAAGSGAYLFAVKHRAQVLDDQLAAVAQQSRLDAQRIRVLQAQWALEIDPTRLNQLSAQFTSLQPMQPTQLVTLAALRDTLPPSGSAAPGANPAGDAQPLPALDEVAAGTPVAEAGSGSGLPLPPDPPPLLLASALAAPSVAVRHAGLRQVSHSVLHVTRYAANLPPPQPYRPAASLAGATLAANAPIGAQVMSVKAVSAPAMAEVGSGSALGLGADLAPPQPLADAGNAN